MTKWTNLLEVCGWGHHKKLKGQRATGIAHQALLQALGNAGAAQVGGNAKWCLVSWWMNFGITAFFRKVLPEVFV